MTVLRKYYTNFTSGEISPLLSSRVDSDAYRNGAKKLSNVRIRAQGGVIKRPGMKYLQTISSYTFADPLKNSQMESFVYDEDEAYIMLFSSNLQSNNGVLNFIDVSTPNSKTEVISNTTKWQTAQVGQLKVAQSRDTMFVVHPDKQMQVVTRTAADTFTVTDFAFDTSAGMSYQPYHKFAGSAVTLTPSGTSGSVTLTASSSVFVAGHDDTYIRLVDSAGTVRHALITAYTSGTAVTATLSDAITNTDAITNWSEQVFSSVRGYARTVQFHDQRLIFGGSRDLPNYIFTSKSGIFTNFDVGTGLDDESIQVQIAESQVSEIKALQSGQHLSIFTSEQELYIPTTENKPLTPSTVTIKKQTTYGSGEVEPVYFDGATVFLTKSKGTIREFLFSDLSQNYKSDSITILSPELVGTPQRLCGQDDAENHVESYLYSVDQSGTSDKNRKGDLAVFMSIRKEKLNGWSKYETRGEIKDIINVNRKIYAKVERQVGQAGLIISFPATNDDWTVGSVLSINTGIGNAFDGYQMETFTCIGSGTPGPGEYLKGANLDGADGTKYNLATAIQASPNFDTQLFLGSSGNWNNQTMSISRYAVPPENVYSLVNTGSTGTFANQIGWSTFSNHYHLQTSIEVFDDDYWFDFSKKLTNGSPQTSWAISVSGGNNYIKWHARSGNTYLGEFAPINGSITLPSAQTEIEVGLDFKPEITTLAPEENLEDGVTVGEKRRFVRAILDVKDTLSIKAGNTDIIKRNISDDLSTAPTPTTARKTVHLLGWTDEGTLEVTQTDPISFGLNGIVTEIEV